MMIARINLLLGTALVIAMAMYLVGRFLIVAPVRWIVPEWSSTAAGIWLLVSLMLGVSSMARIQTRLAAMPAAVVHSIGMLGLTGQALLLAGHILILIAAYRWFAGTLAVNLLVAILPAIVYGLGVIAVLMDLRRRSPEERA
jgi:hypothetical protein